jgi:NAD(P)-dependent dehydrogenase (short-subunit alcohol dehydrogenase family)
VPDDLGVVIVTGGSSGLGAAVADALADEGFTPVVLDRQPPADGLAYREVDRTRARPRRPCGRWPRSTAGFRRS